MPQLFVPVAMRKKFFQPKGNRSTSKYARHATPFLQGSSGSWILQDALTASGRSTQNLKRNRVFWAGLLACPSLLEQSIDELDRDASASCRPLVGGQAVMDGVMMRNGDVYGLAVRRQNGSIVAQRHPWRTILSTPFARIPFLRGFPILLETLYNGIGALNRSALLAEEAGEEKLSNGQLVLSMVVAVFLALALFVLAPHLLSLVMYWLNIGDNVEGLSFHLWDGFFKTCIFLGYIRLISLLPEIQDVLRYHGAEHKTIHAFEKADTVSAETAMGMSRLHPRCGTTFLLFVISISIVLHAILVPFFLMISPPQGELCKHAITLAIKLLLIIPISACAYEIIRGAAKLKHGFFALLLQAPGLFLQKLSTKEPSLSHVEVAVVALYEALDAFDQKKVRVVDFSRASNEH